MKNLLLLGVFILLVTGASYADPVVPWAQPQTFPDQNDGDDELPLFERVMKEERRRKELGITETVNAESIKTRKTVVPSQQTDEPLPKTNASIQKTEKLTPEVFVTLERGAQGPKVQAVQNALLSLGFGLPAGADGDFGGQTESAVKAFQSSANLPLTGKLDEQTFKVLTQVKPQNGKKVWEDSAAATQSIPQAPIVSGKKARVLIDLSEHRLSVYDAAGLVQRVFPVASGADDTPTDVGVKLVNAKLEDPTKLAEKLWPESKGAAFGKRLIDLDWYDPETDKQTVSDEELHGTYVLDSIGSNASHGCVRLTNESIEWLYQNLVLGDIVVIRE
jgi:L,D-transpeptidase YnhG